MLDVHPPHEAARIWRDRPLTEGTKQWICAIEPADIASLHALLSR